MLYAAGNDGGEAYGVGGVVGDAGGAEQLTSTLTNPSQSKNAMVYEGTLCPWLQPTLCHPAQPATLLHHSSLRHTTPLSSHPPHYPLHIDMTAIHRQQVIGCSGTPQGQNMDDLAYFSSVGPTNDGRIKPDVIAPGYFVSSADSVGEESTRTCEITPKVHSNSC
jgi:hypothetical protein